MLQRIKSFLVTLNLFSTNPLSTDPIALYHQRLSTRIFLLLLTSSIISILIYLTVTRFSNTATIDTPIYSQYVELSMKTSDTHICPCSEISVAYKSFLRINYHQHQVCTSDFISDFWIRYLQRNETIESNYYSEDFRSFGISAFQGLQSFCQLTNRTITNNLIRFYANQYVSTTVTSHKTMQLRIQAFFDRFVSSTTNDLQLSLALARRMIHVNGYWSARLTNYIQFFLPGNIYALTIPIYISNCSCLVSPSCKTGFSFYYADATIMYTVPGLYLGCLLTEALLQSDLRCFYNQTCLSQLQFYINKTTSNTFHPLDSTLLTRFTPTSSVQELMNALMVETWNLSFSHEDYYHQCRPSVCAYTYSDRYDIVYVVTTMFSLVGGLITVLKVLIPVLVIFGQQQLDRCKHRETNTPVDRMTFIHFMKRMFNLVTTLNLFASVPPSTDYAEIRQQRLSTILYLTLLFLSVIILFTYMTSTSVSKIEIIPWPSIAEYEKLYKRYSQVLSCPCSQISTRYEDFLRIEYEMHDVCQSVFTTAAWIRFVIAARRGSTVYTTDFRWTSQLLFQALQMFCELSNQTIDDMRNTFYANQYVTNNLLSKHVFELQTMEFSDQFISITANTFLSSLKSVRSLFQANAITSAMGTQYFITKPLHGNYPLMSSTMYGSCDCLLSATCVALSEIYDSLYHTLYTIPGMYFGCTTVDALLQSSLVCLYSQTCIAIFLSYLSYSPSMNVTSLNGSALYTHNINSTVQEIVNHLMVERWKTSALFENYYNNCRPIQCSYTFNSQNDVVYVVTTLFGLIGGLVTILRVIIPLLVRLGQQMIHFQWRLYGNHWRGHNVNNRTTLLQIIRQCSHQALNWSRNFNYFPSIPPSIDPIELRKQRVTTRLFIVLLIVSMITLFIYNAAMKTTKIVTIIWPSFDQYSSYYAIYSDRLTCHCSQINIKYDQFLNVNYSRHPLCESTFISPFFRDSFFPTFKNESITYNDFRAFGSIFFQGLETICDMTNRTITENLDGFYSHQYITTVVPSQDLFYSQTNATFNTFLSSTAGEFSNNFDIIHDVTHMNALMSGRLTSFFIALQPIDGLNDGYWVVTASRKYDGCACLFSSKCVERALLLDRSNPNTTFVIPGFYMGCYNTEALAQSTLECLFNTECLSIMRSLLLVNETISVSPLDKSTLRRFSVNSTVTELLNEILVEEWNFEGSFADYYRQCAPSECTYTVSVRNDLLYLITALFGLMGGLVTISKFLVPLTVKTVTLTVRKYEHRRLTRVAVIQM